MKDKTMIGLKNRYLKAKMQARSAAAVGLSSLTGPSENTFTLRNLQARAVGKGSSCNYIILIYGRQRKDGERMETELPGGSPR